MKSKVVGWIIAGWLLIGSLATAQPGFPGPPEEGPEGQEAKEVLETLRIYMLVRDVGIDQKLGERVFPILREMDQTRDAQVRRLEKIVAEFRELIASGEKMDADQAKKHIQKMHEQRRRIVEEEVRMENEILSLLSPDQQLKFLVFQSEFPSLMRKHLRELRGRMHGRRSERWQNQREDAIEHGDQHETETSDESR
ncbi:hypothetical protein JW905_13480 [bacterium]|nr:hypothetical protein [candidate division CSSED10-310 bacterium]